MKIYFAQSEERGRKSGEQNKSEKKDGVGGGVGYGRLEDNGGGEEEQERVQGGTNGGKKEDVLRGGL